jgi:DNA-binding NtrC family response regulator
MAKVLLIDDDVDLVKMNEVVLKKRGHEITVAYSATEARAKLPQSRPDIIVLDVMMESRDAGFALAREIHKTYPDMPTIMLSSVHEATGVPFRFEPDDSWLPVVKFMDKPVDPSKLVDEIEATLKRIAEEKEKEKEKARKK